MERTKSRKVLPVQKTPGARTPTAFNNPAQGCEERATLGFRRFTPNPERVEFPDLRSPQRYNPFRVGRFLSQPRVGAPASRQPWAGRFNAFGVTPAPIRPA